MFCDKPAKNGYPCTRPLKHTGAHGNERCSACGVDSQYPAKGTTVCSTCKNRRNRLWRQTNPDKLPQAIDRNYFKEKCGRFKLKPEHFEQLLEQQDFKCALCFKPFLTRRVHIDHDHYCYKNHKNNRGCLLCIRGLLCVTCNSARVPWLESMPNEYWPEFIRIYLSSRPFAALESQICQPFSVRASLVTP